MTMTQELSTDRGPATTRPAGLAGVLAQLRTRRADRLARRRLEQELTAYATDADRNDLNALLDLYADADAVVVRDILNSRPVRH